MNEESKDQLADDFDVFRENLIDARKRYTKGNELNAAAAALHAVNGFLQDRCKVNALPAETLIPLNELLSALGDVEGGREHPLVTPVKSKGGRRKNSLHYTYVMATAAAAISFFMENGTSEEEVILPH